MLCPHNMMVESGFSKMKFFEDNYQANFSVDMYNSFRLVADNFSRDAFEDFKPTESLLKLAKSASKMYKDEQTSLQEVAKVIIKNMSKFWFSSGKQIKRWTESSKKQEKNSPKQRLHLFKLKNANKNWKR